MGRKPRQEPIKEYLENARTSFLFSTPAEFRECFGKMSEKYLTPATKGTRLGKKSFRVVVHLPNKQHNDRDNYLAKMKGKWIHNTFLAPNAPIPASRIRWDSPANPGVHLIMHTERGKRVEYFLTPTYNNPNGTMVNGQITFPTTMREWVPLKANTTNKKAVTKADGSKGVWRRSQKLVACPVQVGFFGVSASQKGKYKLTIQKPVADCPKGLTEAGHAPPQFRKEWEPVEETEVSEKVSAGDGEVVMLLQAEGNLVHMAEEYYRAFYEAQNMNYDNLLEIQDVEIMDSETEQQGIERAYYNPSDAMVGTDETLDGYRPIDSATVDLTSNQPMANYGADGESATYAPSDEPDMVSSSSFDEPTNSQFSAHSSCMCKPVCKCAESCRCAESYGAEGETVADVEATVEPANEPVAVAEGTSLAGYAPLDSIEEGAPIGHGVNQFFGSAETEFAMEGVEGALLDESTTNIGIEEGTSLDNFSGVDSVVVEAPLGHGVSQWYAETDGPQPPEPEGITGQDGPSATPTNEYMVLSAEFAADSSRFGKKLTQEEIDDLPDSDFIYGGKRSYPIPNKGYGNRALSWANMASPKKKAHIRKVVHNKFPSLAAEGYDDKMDESLGMRHRGGHKQSFADRRDEASAMDKRHSRMGRKYDDVMTMDAQGYDDKMDESLGMRHRGSHSQSFKDRRDEASAMDKRHGGRKYHDVGTMDLSAENLSRGSKSSFWKGKGGHLYALNDKGEIITHNADTAGYLQDGALSMDGYTPLESVDVDRTSYQPTQTYGADGITSDHPFVPAVKTGAGIAVGLAIPGLLIGTAAMLAMGLFGNRGE